MMKKKMNIGIMGGTFDPLHIGHLVAAETAREVQQLDEVWFIPTLSPPHKESAPRATAQQRWEMLELGIADNRHFRANDYELRQEGPSYTVNTARALRELYSDYTFQYIIGADMVQNLPFWHNIDELLELVTFIGLERGGFAMDWASIPLHIRHKVNMVPMVALDISSTLIRAKHAAGESIQYLVPERVHHYIKEHHLYDG